MNGSNQSTTVQETVQLLRIIVGALIAGVVGFALFVLLVLSEPEQADEGMGIISLVAVFVTVSSLMARTLLPLVLTSRACKQISQQETTAEGCRNQLLNFFKVKTIIETAIPEGAAFLAVMALLLEHQLWTLGLLVPLLGAMFLSFPSVEKVEQWLETQRQNISLNETEN